MNDNIEDWRSVLSESIYLSDVYSSIKSCFKEIGFSAYPPRYFSKKKGDDNIVVAVESYKRIDFSCGLINDHHAAVYSDLIGFNWVDFKRKKIRALFCIDVNTRPPYLTKFSGKNFYGSNYGNAEHLEYQAALARAKQEYYGTGSWSTSFIPGTNERFTREFFFTHTVDGMCRTIKEIMLPQLETVSFESIMGGTGSWMSGINEHFERADKFWGKSIMLAAFVAAGRLDEARQVLNEMKSYEPGVYPLLFDRKFKADHSYATLSYDMMITFMSNAEKLLET